MPGAGPAPGPPAGKVIQVEEDPPPVKPAIPAEESLPAPTEVEPALSLEEARHHIGPEALQVLEERFNGKLTGVRRPDDRDQIF